MFFPVELYRLLRFQILWGNHLQESTIGVHKIRHDLKSERKRVFANFSNNPSNIRLALEIKVLDDRLSELDMALSKQPDSDGRHR